MIEQPHVKWFFLQQFDTELDFTNRIRCSVYSVYACMMWSLYLFSPVFQRQGSEQSHDSLLIINCESGHLDGDLIACARYKVSDERARLSGMNRGLGSTHVLFVIHLPRQSASSSFIGFQGEPWISAHIDELRPRDRNNFDPICAMGRKISQLFLGRSLYLSRKKKLNEKVCSHQGNDIVSSMEAESSSIGEKGVLGFVSEQDTELGAANMQDDDDDDDDEEMATSTEKSDQESDSSELEEAGGTDGDLTVSKVELSVHEDEEEEEKGEEVEEGEGIELTLQEEEEAEEDAAWDERKSEESEEKAASQTSEGMQVDPSPSTLEEAGGADGELSVSMVELSLEEEGEGEGEGGERMDVADQTLQEEKDQEEDEDASWVHDIPPQYLRLHECIQAAVSRHQSSSSVKERATELVGILVDLIPINPKELSKA